MSLKNYRTGLKKTSVNYTPLSPVSFLERTANIFPNYTSIISEKKKFTWRQTFERCKAFANSLKKIGIKTGDTISIISPNTYAMYEAHFSVPMIGAVLNTINIRLDPRTINYILKHSNSKLVLVDTEFFPLFKSSLKYGGIKLKIITINDDKRFSKNLKFGLDYESLLKKSKNKKDFIKIQDEWFPISLCYTSGTTGKPKGVVTHHRGAYLNSIFNQMVWNMKKNPVYLWTLPMFHCNGWCFPWTIAAVAGVNICIRKINPKEIFKLIKKHKVSNLCGTTVIINMLIEQKTKLKKKVSFMTGAAPPPPSILAQIEKQGFEITHTYGLTEVYGPAVVCEFQNDWKKLKPNLIARNKSKQGVKYPGLSNLKVIGLKNNKYVKENGKELGEVCMKGNTVMMGYYKDETSTKKTFKKGWFRTGDLAVVDKNGYIQIKDRSKDIIISGGENISSIEIENVLNKHKDIVDAAVVSKYDKKWGEVPCAFITIRKNSKLNDHQIVEFCRKYMAKFKIPKKFIFGKITKTSTGKTKKFVLRKLANQFN